MMDVGRLCLKIAGRDAGKKCVIVDVLDDHTLLIDGQTRRRKCNIMHIEPTREVLKIKKGASHAEIVAVFKKLGLEMRESKPKKAGPRPHRLRKAGAGKAVIAPVPAEKPAKEKKTEKK